MIVLVGLAVVYMMPQPNTVYDRIEHFPISPPANYENSQQIRVSSGSVRKFDNWIFSKKFVFTIFNVSSGRNNLNIECKCFWMWPCPSAMITIEIEFHTRSIPLSLSLSLLGYLFCGNFLVPFTACAHVSTICSIHSIDEPHTDATSTHTHNLADVLSFAPLLPSVLSTVNYCDSSCSELVSVCLQRKRK